MKHLLNLQDFQRAAHRHLPKPLYEYIAGAVEDNRSLNGNTHSFQRYAFLPRVLRNVALRTSKVELLGHEYASPFGIAPMGIVAMYAYRGDIVLARAAGHANIPVIMSGSSLIPLEEVVKVNPHAWFQAYLPGDEINIRALIARVASAGFKTLVITVDTPVAANRENNVRAGFSTPLRPGFKLAWEGVTHPRWLINTLLRTLIRHGMPHFENNYAHRSAPIISSSVARDFSDRGHFDWSHIELIRGLWAGKLVIKGILHPADAARAVQLGADGIIVSNHGGRQLDGAVSPLRVLPNIVQVCPGVPVMLDGGVRRGSDVLKALALGASFVFVGRPFAYAAAVGADQGVLQAVRLLADEVDRNMGMLGIRTLAELDRDFLLRDDQTL
ncbi:alpha-hydroxy-acid oxidizing protein [Pseudomonas gingeri]|uniref:Alpha-hydroxy-acid oxidizing protein n=1 Tax=Pseudomonas gingeri TaxID=117681 RepID=A0A7Y7XJ21_9PSED|nr:alpha-hydroxy acid oxidase [Pseudomonas gingeri]NWB99778.1 alpha-hydroxy-acid oxidizing protein [Pseudomonas gingeri]